MGDNPSPLGSVLKKIVENLGAQKGVTEEEIKDIWRDAAGEKAAKHSHPVSLKGAIITVNVDGSSWLYQLTTEKKEITRRLKERLGDKKIKDIRFRIGELTASQ